jgi:hypothetical protein
MAMRRGPRRSSCSWLASAVVAGAAWTAPPQAARADPQPPAAFAGAFSDGQLRLDLTRAADGGLTGTLTRGVDAYPVTAGPTDRGITGSFVAAGHAYPFTATLTDGRLVLQSGGRTYALAPAATNAAVGPAAAAPAAAVAPLQAGPFADFQVLGTTATGQTLFVRLPAATTLASALTQAADALAKGLDGKPALSGAFANAKDPRTGGVTLTGRAHGRDVRGLIFCGPAPAGSTATVILAAADAPREDVASLFDLMPAPPARLQTHRFPDGSGSVDLPDGWTAMDSSAAHGIHVRGPAGQAVVFCDIIGVSDPNCRLVRLSHQAYALSLQNYQGQTRQYQRSIDMHRRFPNTPVPTAPTAPVAPDPDPNVAIKGGIFCPYCDGAAEVLKSFYPISEANQRRAGGPYTVLEKVIAVVPLPADPAQPNAKAGVAYLSLTDHDGPKATRVRALNRIATANIMPGEQWQLMFCNMRAPDATFDVDLPVMAAIMNSVKIDTQVTGGEIAAEGAAARKMGDEMFQQTMQRGRDFQNQQDASFAAHQQQVANQQQAVHDSASDFIEYIGGVRHVYDTQSGRMLNVDLFNANGIVNGLNDAANDPTRFVQVPLRYER